MLGRCVWDLVMNNIYPIAVSIALCVHMDIDSDRASCVITRCFCQVVAIVHRTCQEAGARERGSPKTTGISLREWSTCHLPFLVPDLLNSLGSDHIWHSPAVYA